MSFLSVLAETLGKYEVDGPTDWPSPPFYLLIGNGGSMAVAKHIANDMIKGGILAITPDTATLSCLANDYGWEMALTEWVMTAETSGCLIAISSSGRSENITNACRAYKGTVITLSGFKPDNPLRKLGHTNYYVPSHNYGIVECAHLAILHSIVNPGEI